MPLCAYGSPQCAGIQFKTATGAHWHSGCPGGQAASVANLIAKDAGLSIRRELATAGRVETSTGGGTADEAALVARVWAASQLVRALELRGIGLTGRARYGLQAALTQAIAGGGDDFAWLAGEGGDDPGGQTSPTPATVVARHVTLRIDELDAVPLPANASLATHFLSLGLHRTPQEAVWVLAYDAQMNTRTVVEVARGGFHRVNVDMATLLTAVVGAATDRFVIAHNHPGQDPTPSDADISLTFTVMQAANTCGLRFEDHIVIGSTGESFSFVEHGLLVPPPWD